MKSLFLFITLSLVGILASCSDTQITQPSGAPLAILSAPEMAIPVQEPGKLHNDIVAAFFQHWPSDPARRSPEEFCAALARAANQVLPAYGAPPIVQASDMAYFVRETLETWKQAGFDPGDPAADPVVIAHLLRTRGIITAEEHQFLTQFIQAQRTSSSVQSAALAESELASTSENIRVFLDVNTASEVLWAGDVISRRPAGWGTSWGTKVVDGVAALSKLRPILRVLGAATASVLFEQFAGDVWDYFGDYPPVPPPTIP